METQLFWGEVNQIKSSRVTQIKLLYAACRKGSAVVAFSDIFTVALAEFVVVPDRDRDTVEGNDELIFFFF